jgi:hydroxymethylpyrimidine pyrophosphatase-like HAD family hydrolase
VDAVVGENGALVFWEVHTASSGVGSSRSERKSTSLHSRPEGTPVHAASGRKRILKQEFHPDAVRNDHPVLQKIKERALAEVPGLRIAKDQFARLFDLALDFAEEEPILSLETAEQVRTIAEEEGAQAKISSIHVNIWMGNYDKLSMTRRFLQNRFVPCDQLFDDSSVLFVGDSPNDEPMFARFPLACAVANISRYKGFIQHLPTFVSQKECGEGFAEIVETLLEKRQLYR